MGPVMPICVMKGWRGGVSLNGTGLLASESPAILIGDVSGASLQGTSWERVLCPLSIMRWSMRLLRSDNVVKKSGTPTSASLILALQSLHLSETVDTVKSHFP